jgi:hypothetical protein
MRDRILRGRDDRLDSETRLAAGTKVLAITTAALLLGLLMSWLLYGLFGHQLLEILYKGEVTWLRDRIMRGRGIYPLEEYYRQVEALMLIWTLRAFWVVACLLLLIAFLRLPLSDTKTMDFRFIPFGVVLCYMLALLFSQFYFGSYSVIADYFAIHPRPYFGDLKVLLCGIDAVRSNQNPYTALCLLDGNPDFNYPYIWGFLASFPFITESNALYIGIALASLFFSFLYFFIGRINLSGAIIYSALLLSPAVMLGVERGNSDLIIFLLLLIPVFYYSSQKLLAFVVLIAGMLKLFPIGAITAIFYRLKDNKKQSFVLFFSIGLAFLFYLILATDNILLVSQKTPRPYRDSCYGLGTLPSLLGDYFPSWRLYITAIYPLIILFGYFPFYRLVGKQLGTVKFSANKASLSFVIGSSIFIITCLIGYNFEYRLTFLLFTIPQILIWISENNQFVFLPLLLSILILWQSFIGMIAPQTPFKLDYFYISQIFVVVLFYCHITTLFEFVKERLEQILPLISIKKFHCISS